MGLKPVQKIRVVDEKWRIDPGAVQRQFDAITTVINFITKVEQLDQNLILDVDFDTTAVTEIKHGLGRPVRGYHIIFHGDGVVGVSEDRTGNSRRTSILKLNSYEIVAGTTTATADVLIW